MADQPNPPAKKSGPSQLGKYSLVREVGRGGMGVVYEAVDGQTKRKVALKLMIPRPYANAEQAEQDRQRFVREAQMAAKLKHPSIVTLYEAGELQGHRFLAMEFVEGRAFSSWWKQKGVTLRQKAAVLRDVALAVDHAHEQGILHRDLKPANILVGADNRPYVMDFGLAKAFGADTGLSITGDGFAVGTPAYMSPEQARGLKTVDARADVYSLGVMLYEILTGRQPFEGETAIEILMKASKGHVAPPSSARHVAADPELDKAIENICLKALEKNPRDRYASAKILAQDLTKWIEGEAVTVHPTMTRRKMVAQRRSPVLVYGIVGGVAALALGAFLLLRGGPPDVEAELARARRFMDEKNFTEARVEYGKALGRDPLNAEAVEGDRRARRAEEDRKAELRRQSEEAQAQSARDADLVAQKAKAAAGAASEAEQKRLLDELQALKDKARLAEDEAKKAKERLEALQARSEAPPPPSPAPVPAPVPVPAPAPDPNQKPMPAPPVKPPPPAKPAVVVMKDPRVAAASMKDAVDAAVERLDFAALSSAVDRFAADAGADPLATKADALRRARKQVKAPKDASLLAAAHLRLTEESMESEDLKIAQQASKDALAIAKQAGDAALAEEAAALAKDVTALQPEVDRFAKAQKALAANPADAAATLDVGRHLCLIRDRWDEGLPLLVKGSDDALRKLAQQELAMPTDASGRKALADGWWASAQKERSKPLKNGALGRALQWYEQAQPGLRGAERAECDQRIDACFRLAPVKTRVSFVPERSMKPYPVGYRTGTFPEQKTDDATGPFRGEAVYFDQRTGTDAVFDVRSGRRLSHLTWKGAAMAGMTIDVLDLAGTVLASGGPYAGGNQWGTFKLDFPPMNRFTLRFRNHISVWYLVDTVELK